MLRVYAIDFHSQGRKMLLRVEVKLELKQEKGDIRMAYQGNHPLTDEMKHNPHVQSLLQQHDEIEEELRTEMAQPWMRDEKIRRLKMKKLRITEEIVRQQRH